MSTKVVKKQKKSATGKPFFPPVGLFDKPITIQYPEDVIGTGGKTTRNWRDLCKTWASIVPGAGSEKFIGGQVYPVGITTFTIRYRPSMNINSTMQVAFGTRRYNIRRVIVPNESQIVISLVCEELQTQGSLH